MKRRTAPIHRTRVAALLLSSARRPSIRCPRTSNNPLAPWRKHKRSANVQQGRALCRCSGFLWKHDSARPRSGDCTEPGTRQSGVPGRFTRRNTCEVPQGIESGPTRNSPGNVREIDFANRALRSGGGLVRRHRLLSLPVGCPPKVSKTTAPRQFAKQVRSAEGGCKKRSPHSFSFRSSFRPRL